MDTAQQASAPPPSVRPPLMRAARRVLGSKAGQSDVPHSRRILASAVALIASKVSTMTLGFAFWLVAARLLPPAHVGLAAGAVSAMMLCTQLALLGIGSSVIVHFPRHRTQPAHLLDTAFTLVVVAALVAAGLFVMLASVAFDELGVIASAGLFTVAFVAMGVLGTVQILMDQISTALRRGDQALMRSLLFGGIALAFLVSLHVATGSEGALGIFAAWVAGGVGACALGCLQLRRSLGGYRYRPRLQSRLVRGLLGAGFPNHALTLMERAPGLVLPILVTELLSPAANAAWYVAWMMAWVVYIIPIQVGMTSFAEVARRPAAARELVAHGIRLSLVLAVPAVAFTALAAGLLLSVLGGAYADAGTTPLRILLLAAVPLAFTQGYFVTCRSTRRWGEVLAIGTVSALVSVCAAAAAGVTFGLTGMALAWVATQGVTGVWASWRLRRRVESAANVLSAEVSLRDGTGVPEESIAT
jgi:O-antigen/teichoic acid export membrane protein